MTEPKRTKKRKPEQVEKGELVAMLLKAYQESPEEMWATFPAMAAELDKFLSPKRSASNAGSLHYSHLLEREKDFRLKRLASVIEKARAMGVSREEAVQALEDAAALREESSAYKDALLALLERTVEFPLHAEAERTVYFQKGKLEHHTFTLARGITLSLTWDAKLIKIVFDPKEFAKRQKALSFVGVASDKQSDVARRHDYYLGDALAEQ